MPSKIITALLYTLLALAWCIILVFSYVIIPFSPLIKYFWNGGFIVIFGIVGALAIVLPIIFRKRLCKNWLKPTAMLALTVVMIGVNYGVYKSSECFLSKFNRHIWATTKELQIYMTDDLKYNHNILSKTEGK